MIADPLRVIRLTALTPTAVRRLTILGERVASLPSPRPLISLVNRRLTSVFAQISTVGKTGELGHMRIDVLTDRRGLPIASHRVQSGLVLLHKAWNPLPPISFFPNSLGRGF